jgi:predicted nucleic acid-binding Zn ribbon protein
VSADRAASRPPRRRAPRPLALALERLSRELVPATPLARVQTCWEAVVGQAIAAAAQPTAERAGTLTVTCAAAVWAQELDLMAPTLLDQLNAALGGPSLSALRCRVG